MMNVTIGSVFNNKRKNINRMIFEYCSTDINIDFEQHENEDFFISGQISLDQARSLMYFLKMAIDVKEKNEVIFHEGDYDEKKKIEKLQPSNDAVL